MNLLKPIVTSLLLIITLSAFAQQQAELLSELPKTKEEFVKSEPNVLATIDWLENTPVNEEKDKHKVQYALLLGWLSNSPTVTVTLNSKVLTFTKKNEELLMFFMAGWTRYALENDYSKDIEKGSLAGIRSVIKVYQKGGLKKDKNIQKLIDLDEKGELEAWVAKKM